MSDPRATKGQFASRSHRTLAQVELTERILDLRQDGKTYKEIARQIDVLPETVEKVARYYARVPQ